MKLVMQSFINRSKPILQKAVALDRENKKDEAVENYAEGITLLLGAMSCELLSLSFAINSENFFDF